MTHPYILVCGEGPCCATAMFGPFGDWINGMTTVCALRLLVPCMHTSLQLCFFSYLSCFLEQDKWLSEKVILVCACGVFILEQDKVISRLSLQRVYLHILFFQLCRASAIFVGKKVILVCTGGNGLRSKYKIKWCGHIKICGSPDPSGPN